MERLLLKVDEAAEILNISRSQMYKLINEGKVPVVRLGPKCTRIPADLVPWLHQVTRAQPKR